MQAVLYVFHGSRNKNANQEALQLVNMTRKLVPLSIQEISFLEKVEPSILQGIESCVEKGASKIIVVPVFLLAATHVNNDIPAVISHAKEIYPQVRFTYTLPLGVHEKMVTAIMSRINEYTTEVANEKIVLVGHGSTDSRIAREMDRLVGLLKNGRNFQSIDVCYLSRGEPKFETMLEKLYFSSDKDIIIVPYLLFSGLLLERIEKMVGVYGESFTNSVVVTKSIGAIYPIAELLAMRIMEAVHNEES